jgi:hypothetical protein
MCISEKTIRLVNFKCVSISAICYVQLPAAANYLFVDDLMKRLGLLAYLQLAVLAQPARLCRSEKTSYSVRSLAVYLFVPGIRRFSTHEKC